MTSDLTLSRRAAAEAYLQRNRQALGAGGPARLIFALDATMSRSETWDVAATLQSEMFATVAKVGGLEVQLVYYLGVGKFVSSEWTSEEKDLAARMRRVRCESGETQILRTLRYIRGEHARKPIGAAIFVGDCVEEEPGVLYDAAAGLPQLFLFQEGADPKAEIVFRELARLTKGAYAKFDSSAARELAELLRAVAVFAAGGMRALTDLRTEGARRLLTQLK
jgi:hypothetical protein